MISWSDSLSVDLVVDEDADAANINGIWGGWDYLDTSPVKLIKPRPLKKKMSLKSLFFFFNLPCKQI